MVSSPPSCKKGGTILAYTIATFREFLDLLAQLPEADEEVRSQVSQRNRELTKPEGSLGRLEDLAIWLAGWQGRTKPSSDNGLVTVFAANHGVVAQGISAFPQEVTAQMVSNFHSGGAAINCLCDYANVRLAVFALELDRPTLDITLHDAMNEDECLRAISCGMNAVPDDLDLLAIGEMGIGNTTIASAMCTGLFGEISGSWAGQGTGVQGTQLLHKQTIVASSVARMHRDWGLSPSPLRVLCSLGGREIAAMAGAIVAARLSRIPVVVDGFVSSTAAAVLHRIAPETLDHCVFSHVSAENAHRTLLRLMEKSAILDLEMRLGEGSGAALAMNILKAAVATHNGMHTFSQALVTQSS